MSNYSTAQILTAEGLAGGFFIDKGWYIIGLVWTPSVILGLPSNLLVIYLGKEASSLGNFRFAINAVSIINSLHLIARAVILLHYFSHLLFSLRTSVIECSIMGNVLDQWMGYYIVFYIPLLALYRYILLFTKGGDVFLSKKRNVWLMIITAAVIPTVYVIGKLYGMVTEHKIQTDEMCPYKYDDNLCTKWCDPFYEYGVYLSYCLSVVLSVLLLFRLYRSFRRVHIHGQRRRLLDELMILAGIIVQLLVPLVLTIPARAKTLLLAVGINFDKNIFQGIYNYNPLCDAILTIICVKPYRRAFLRLIHLDGEHQPGIDTRNRIEYHANRVAALQVNIDV